MIFILVTPTIIFLFTLYIQAHDNFLEPTFEELGIQLKSALAEGGGLLVNQLANRLMGFSSPEDLFSFALGLRGINSPDCLSSICELFLTVS